MGIESLYTSEDHESGAEMQVKNSAGIPVDLFLTVVGPDSETYRKMIADITKKAMLLKDGEEMDVNERAAQLSKTVKSWRGELGKEYSREAVYVLLKNAPYICDQIDSFIGKRANFIKN